MTRPFAHTALRLASLLLVPLAAQCRVCIVQDTPEPMAVLARVLERHGHPATVEDQKGLRARIGKFQADAVFMYIHNVMDADIEKFLISYAENGGRLIVLHHGIASGRMKNPAWMQFLAMTLRPRNAPEHPWTVVQGEYRLVLLNPDHEVATRKVQYPGTVAYRSSDSPSAEGRFPAIALPDTELFVNQIFTDGRRKEILFGMMGVIGGKTYMQDRAGWTMKTKKGRVFYFMPGHAAHDFENPGFAQILVNAIEWREPR